MANPGEHNFDWETNIKAGVSTGIGFAGARFIANMGMKSVLMTGGALGGLAFAVWTGFDLLNGNLDLSDGSAKAKEKHKAEIDEFLKDVRPLIEAYEDERDAKANEIDNLLMDVDKVLRETSYQRHGESQKTKEIVQSAKSITDKGVAVSVSIPEARKPEVTTVEFGPNDVADQLKSTGVSITVPKHRDVGVVVRGSNEDDIISGTKYTDVIDGGAGDDFIFLGDGLKGSSARPSDQNKAYGGYGDDTIEGGKRADIMKGGYGDDTFTGNGGADYFSFNNGGKDTVTDFDWLGSDHDSVRFFQHTNLKAAKQKKVDGGWQIDSVTDGDGDTLEGLHMPTAYGKKLTLDEIEDQLVHLNAFYGGTIFLVD